MRLAAWGGFFVLWIYNFMQVYILSAAAYVLQRLVCSVFPCAMLLIGARGKQRTGGLVFLAPVFLYSPEIEFA
jgi:hypothetical protein